MKVKQLLLTVIGGATFFLAACSTDETGNATDWGKAQFHSQASDDAILVSKSSLGLTNLPSPNSFSLQITGTDGYNKKWETISAYENETLYNANETYSAVVSHGDLTQEGFDRPCFTGKKEFSVEAEKTTNVSITATIANAIVTIETTDAFKNYFPNYSFTLTTAANKAIAFPKSETRKAYINPSDFTIKGIAYAQTGVEKSISAQTYSNIATQTLYKVTYDVNNGSVGGATLIISFNDNIVATEPIKIELNPQD